MKDLLKIIEIKDGICSAETGCEDSKDWERLAASVLSLMARCNKFAAIVCSAAYLYSRDRRAISDVTEAAIRSAKAKTQN